MNHKEARKLVADALRSGKYKQGKGSLCRTSTYNEGGNTVVLDQPEYCCLGVACEVYNEQIAPLTIKSMSEQKSYDGTMCFLPPVVSDWLNMGSAGRFNKQGGWSYLTTENDTFGKSFEEIADLFEKADFAERTPGDANVTIVA